MEATTDSATRCRDVYANLRAAWHDPEYRAKIAAAMRRPEVRAKLRAAWQDPEYRAQRSGANHPMRRRYELTQQIKANDPRLRGAWVAGNREAYIARYGDEPIPSPQKLAALRRLPRDKRGYIPLKARPRTEDGTRTLVCPFGHPLVGRGAQVGMNAKQGVAHCGHCAVRRKRQAPRL